MSTSVVIVGFRIIARVSEALPGRAIFSPEFSGIFRDFPGFFGTFRSFSVFFEIFRQGQRPWREPRAQGAARHLKAPPGRAVRFSAYNQHWSNPRPVGHEAAALPTGSPVKGMIGAAIT